MPRNNAVGMLTEFLPAFDGEQLMRPTHGPSLPVLTQAVMVPAEPEPLLTVFAHDISERKQFEEQLAHQARHDALTGLPNRFAVLEHLESVLLNGADQCAVMFVDIDGFKSVNDSHRSRDRRPRAQRDRRSDPRACAARATSWPVSVVTSS